jgi:hypothetical protein
MMAWRDRDERDTALAEIAAEDSEIKLLYLSPEALQVKPLNAARHAYEFLHALALGYVT